MPRFRPPPMTGRPVAPTSEPDARDDGHVITIGDLARDFGLTLRALRFYESKGMLRPSRRGLTRLYSAADRERLALILKGKELGLSLREIRETVGRAGAGAGSEPGLRLSEAVVAEKIATLEAQKREIERAIAGLRGHQKGAPSAKRRRAA